jgi:hypothetical protein
LPELVPTISTAVTFGALIVPLVAVSVPVFRVACRARWPDLGVMSRSAKVMLPLLLVRTTPVLPAPAMAELLTVVLPKLGAPAELVTEMPVAAAP